MANPYRATVTYDSETFEALSVSVSFDTLKDQAQMPVMGSLTTTVRVWVDMHDTENMPHAKLKALFEAAKVVTNEKIKTCKIEVWKDDAKEDALCAYNFKGWISKFQTSNPLAETGAQTGGVSNTSLATVNNLLVLDFEAAMNQSEFGEISMSN